MPSESVRRTDWEHILFIAVMLSFLVWYLWTATAASPTFSNLILIAPVGAIAGVLLIYVAATEVFGHRAVAPASGAPVETAAEPAPSRLRASSLATIMLLMLLVALFVVGIPYIGFDLATFFFVIATLWLLGERRVIFSLSLALGIAVALSVAALTLLTFPMPLMLARSLWSSL